MTDSGVALVLSAEERALVEALREVPESPLRHKMVALLEALFAYARELQQLEGASEPIVVTCPGVASGTFAGATRMPSALRVFRYRLFSMPRAL